MVINKEKCKVVELAKNHVGSDYQRDVNRDFERMRKSHDKAISSDDKMKLSYNDSCKFKMLLLSVCSLQL